MTNRLAEGRDSWGVVGVALLTSLSILGCGSDSPSGPTASDTPTPVATTITLSPTTLSFSSFGATEQLTPTVRDQNGATMAGAPVAWASSAPTVASVSSTGLVEAVADGQETITATSGSASGAITVTVLQAALPTGGRISLADDAVSLVFPPGAVSVEVRITAEPATQGLPAQPVPISGTSFAFGPNGIVFAEPVTLTIAYDPANVPQGVPEEELRLHELVGSAYVLVDAGVVDVTNNTVSGEIDGFSVFAILRTLSVTTASLASGLTGTAYSQTLTATGGDGNYAWALFNSTALPAGLELNTATGEISGTPEAAGTTPFEIEVTSAGQTATKALSITVDVAPIATTSVTVGNNFFDPEDIQVSPGATVMWTWAGGVSHNVTFASSAIANSTTQSNGTYTTAMPTATGTYTYLCTIHPTTMNGAVTVQ